MIRRMRTRTRQPESSCAFLSKQMKARGGSSSGHAYIVTTRRALFIGRARARLMFGLVLASGTRSRER
eukprot:12406193-Karenia_brevis.AAC.1